MPDADRTAEECIVDQRRGTCATSLDRAPTKPAIGTDPASRIILACEQDPSNKAVAADLGVGAHTVGKWRNRFITHRLEGLRDHLT